MIDCLNLNGRTLWMLTSLFSIDATVNSETFKHSQFVTLKMKDAIVDYFGEKI